MKNVINEQVYSCPMHPEVTGNKGDKCPKCGMELVQRSGEKQNIAVHLTINPEILEAGKEANLQFRIKKGNHLVSVETSHEKKVHLIIVNEDLSWFDHVHPAEQADGTFVVNETFPYHGKYLLYMDFKPERSAGEMPTKSLYFYKKLSVSFFQIHISQLIVSQMYKKNQMQK